MLTFVVFVVSSLLIGVQLASGAVHAALIAMVFPDLPSNGSLAPSPLPTLYDRRLGANRRHDAAVVCCACRCVQPGLHRRFLLVCTMARRIGAANAVLEAVAKKDALWWRSSIPSHLILPRSNAAVGDLQGIGSSGLS